MGDRVLLGDHASHGDADHVEVGDAEAVDERLRVLCEERRRVGPGRLVGRADPAVVEAQDAEPGLEQRRSLVAPALEVVGEAVDEHHRLGAVALQAVVDRDAVHLCRAHSGSLPSGNTTTGAVT